MRHALTSTLLLSTLVLTPAATAEPLQPVFTINEEVDLPLIVGLGTLWLVPELGLKDQFASPTFDAALTYPHIGDMDRASMGQWDPTADLASDVLLGVSFGLPFLLNGVDDAVWGSKRADAARWFWADSVILMQAVAFAGALTNLAKLAFDRYRPYMYIIAEEAFEEDYDAILATEASRASYEEAIEDPDAGKSFWSGHTSLIFTAMCTSAALLTYKHLDDHPAPLFGLWGGTVAMGVAMAALRVQAGLHFPSDVIVGAIVGTATGLVVPALHRNRKPLPMVIAPSGGRDGGGVSLSLVW